MYENQSLIFVDLDKLKDNFLKIKEKCNGAKVGIVLKANAYGLGACTVAEFLQKQGADYFCVANFSEAMELRKKKIKLPILILGYVPNALFEKLIKNNVELTVYNIGMIRELNEISAKCRKKCKIHIKIDTGMNRLGFLIDEKLKDYLKEIYSMKNIIVKGMFTHLCVSDIEDYSFTKLQVERFEKVKHILVNEKLKVPMLHIANDGGSLLHSYYYDMVRVGIGIYGHYPSEYVKDNSKIKMDTVVSFVSTVSNIKYIHKGDTVGYGRAFCADKTIKVATISVGYADGYPYELSNKGYVIINNKKAKILGRVCMDQTMIDVSDIDDVKIGDTVLLYGEYKDMKLDIFEIAKIANTNVYDLICRINMRIPRVYLEGDKVVRVVDYLSTENNYYEL